MENLTKKTLDSLIGTSGTSTTNTLNIDKIGDKIVFDNTQHTTSTSYNLYSKPELIDTIVTKDYIELVYKRQYMVSNNWGMPNPEIYKDVYSRHGGGVRRVIGTYVPAQSETYEFE